MSNVARVASTAANTLTTPPSVEDVFSTYLYDGTGATQTITNGIDLDGEGGMTWIKLRNSASNHELYDTERGATYSLCTNTSNAPITRSTGLTSFNSNGFTVGSGTNVNANNYDVASWTFRKAPKFFDVVTWTGDGTNPRTINHNLGCDVGFMVIKRTDNTNNWHVWHRSVTGYGVFNNTAAWNSSTTLWASTNPTSTSFTVSSESDVNATNATYVAYLFAHNNGDGTFGPTGDQDIIKCGSYTGNGSTTGPEVDIGFEPQWIIIKRTDSTGGWRMLDVMRGITDSGSQEFSAQDAAAESGGGNQRVYANGYQPLLTGSAYNASGGNYIYIAIRRGPMAVPESATDVFAIDNGIGSIANPAFDSPFPVDFVIQKDQSGSATYVGSRLIGANYLEASSTSAQTDDTGWVYDHMDGYYSGNRETDDYSWMWKRAPNYFDVVAYTGDGTAGRDIPHNLGVTPEMIWVKKRSSATDSDWAVYHTGLAQPYHYIRLNLSNAYLSDPQAFDSGNHTATTFSVGLNARTNGSSGQTYIAYLFASLDGVSKVGSYDGTGGTNTQVIDCGFSAGARFVLLKRYNASGYDWQVFDTERGITSGNDAKLALNTTAAESTLNWGINPNSSGFEVTGNGLNETGGSWIFYAIA